MKKKYLSILGDLISFGTFQAIVINIFLIFLLLTILPTSTFGDNHNFCVFKNFIIPLFFKECPTSGIFENCECPACGMTRAFSSFMHGNLNSARDYNRGIFLLIPTMFVVLCINIFKWVKFYKKKNKLF